MTDPDKKAQLAAGSIANMRDEIEPDRSIAENADLMSKVDAVLICIKA
jgi:hypothetical protein